MKEWITWSMEAWWDGSESDCLRVSRSLNISFSSTSIAALLLENVNVKYIAPARQGSWKSVAVIWFEACLALRYIPISILSELPSNWHVGLDARTFYFGPNTCVVGSGYCSFYFYFPHSRSGSVVWSDLIILFNIFFFCINN